MSRTSTIRTTLSPKNSNNLYVKVKNVNESQKRQLQINVFIKDSSSKELLPVYVDDQLTRVDTLMPGTEREYRIDVSGVKEKVILEIIQTMGGSGVRVSRNNKNRSFVELQLK